MEATKRIVKHTAGPWSYHKWGIASGTRFGIETANHRHGLASIAPNENASTLLTMEEHEANARLMAAAPDLLKALKFMRRTMHSDTSEESIMADEAIAKAESTE